MKGIQTIMIGSNCKTLESNGEYCEANDLNTFPTSLAKPPTQLAPSSLPMKEDSEARKEEETGIVRISGDLFNVQKVCNSCKKPFVKYAIRNGIHIGLMVPIIILSCLLFVFLILFLFLCKQYRVCPNCGKFVGDDKSNSKNVCLW
eukprot:TRINITY_DN17161_c0_g1_i5.p2 TRINITY_DN17161_c0_g1~~TRINITY_DN17161_c0_g1_i5.p2  ORF type:complete len:146 (+),score=37.32 TRINITY_DN17161_c0_g1_i5:116-553(+)